MISATELTSMQADVQTSMPDTATIQRNTPASTAGGWGQSFTTAATTKCHLAPIGPSSEALAADELAAVTKWLLATPAGTDIRPSDRIVCNGKTFEVSGGTGSKTWEITRNFYLTEILRT